MVASSLLSIWLLQLLSCGAYASSQSLHLRTGRGRSHLSPSATFDKLDLNKDGRIDRKEFLVAEHRNALVSMKVQAVAAGASPAPVSVAAPGFSPIVPQTLPVAAPAPVIAAPPAPAPAPDNRIPVDQLPPWATPPPLPEDIPEPPPPPGVPPREPEPPPLPPEEGQLVAPPPSEGALAPAGNLTEMMAETLPGLDLEGRTPVQVPNTPPPLPKPIDPPALPLVMQPRDPPPLLDPSLMTPAPREFGMDVGRMIPEPEDKPHRPVMPKLPDLAELKKNPKGK